MPLQAAIRKTWAKRQKKREMETQKRIKEALCCANKVAHLLKEKYGVNKVYLYGLLARGNYFDKLSDIDLYPEFGDINCKSL